MVAEGNSPVKTVPAEVHEATPRPLPLVKSIEHCCGPVFGVATCNDDSVGRQGVIAVDMEVFVGNYVVVYLCVDKKRIDIGVGREIPSIGTWTNLHNRSSP